MFFKCVCVVFLLRMKNVDSKTGVFNLWFLQKIIVEKSMSLVVSDYKWFFFVFRYRLEFSFALCGAYIVGF